MVDYKLLCIALITIIGILIPSVIFTYIDEILAVIGAIYAIRNYHKLLKYEKIIVKILILLFITGFVGTVKNKYQINIWPVLLDMEGCSKFFLVFILGRHYTLELSNRRKIKTIKAVNNFIVPFVIIGFVCGLINFFVDIGMSYEIRLGFRTFRYIFTDSAQIGLCWSVVMLFLTANYMLNPRIYNFAIILMALTVWFLTFKSRAILFVIIYLLLFYWIVLKRKKIKINVLSISIIVGFSLFITFDQIENYFLSGSETMPRTVLLTGGIQTMMRFLPFGAGFGTYGTDVAAKYYSNLYYEMGYDKLYGLTPEEPVYAHDSYWPAIMGEFGIIGVLLIIILLWIIFKIIMKDYSVNKYALFCGLYTIIIQYFASVPTSVFFQANTIFLILLLPIITLKGKQLVSY